MNQINYNNKGQTYEAVLKISYENTKKSALI